MNRACLTLLASLTALSRLCAADFQPTTLALGSPAPDFRLPGVDGRTNTLKDFAEAKILVVVFTCNHCPTAQYYEDRLKQLASDYRSKGVALVAIMPNDPKSVRLDELGWTDLSDSFQEMKIRARDRQFNFPYLYDGDTEAVARAYGPVATPHAFVFDAARKLRYVGAIDDSERVQHVTKSLRARRARRLAGGPGAACDEDEGRRVLGKVGGQGRVGESLHGKACRRTGVTHACGCRRADGAAEERIGQVPPGQFLGDVVCAVCRGVSRVGHHQPHVSAPGFRVGDGFSEPA